jgi:hypothetical protein
VRGTCKSIDDTLIAGSGQQQRSPTLRGIVLLVEKLESQKSNYIPVNMSALEKCRKADLSPRRLFSFDQRTLRAIGCEMFAGWRTLAGLVDIVRDYEATDSYLQ